MAVDEGILAIIELTATKTAEKVVAVHQAACSIDSVARDIYGNGQPGIKSDVEHLKMIITAHRGRRVWWERIAQGVITAFLAAAILYMTGLAKNGISVSSEKQPLSEKVSR